MQVGKVNGSRTRTYFSPSHVAAAAKVQSELTAMNTIAWRMGPPLHVIYHPMGSVNQSSDKQQACEL